MLGRPAIAGHFPEGPARGGKELLAQHAAFLAQPIGKLLARLGQAAEKIATEKAEAVKDPPGIVEAGPFVERAQVDRIGVPPERDRSIIDKEQFAGCRMSPTHAGDQLAKIGKAVGHIGIGPEQRDDVPPLNPPVGRPRDQGDELKSLCRKRDIAGGSQFRLAEKSQHYFPSGPHIRPQWIKAVVKRSRASLQRLP